MATAYVAVNDVSISEGNSGTKTITFTVSRSNNSGSFSVNYATANGTAVSGSDYAAKSGKLTFTAGGSLSQTVSVTVNGDTAIEANENFFLKLSSLANTKGSALITDNSGTGTITNDDTAAAANVTINDVSVSEGSAGTKLLTFTVTRSSTAGAFSVNYATADGTATAASGDYVATSGKLTFAAGGPATQTVSVVVNGDTLVEGNETLAVNLSGIVNTSGTATITDASGVGTITNDDTAAANISVSDVTLTEGEYGTQIATFTVSRSDSKGYFSIDYATADGTATGGKDYLAKAGTLTFTNGGALSQTVSVTVKNDIAVEGDETFGLNLSNVVNTSGSAVVADGVGTATIVDNDTGTTVVTSTAELVSAALSAEGGELILLASGNYGNTTINGAVPTSTVTIAEAPGATATFNQLTVKFSDNLSFDGFEIGHTSYTDSNEYALFLWNADDVQLRNMSIHGSLDGNSWNDARGIRLLNSTGILIDSSTITDVKNGLALEKSSNVVFSNNVMSIMREGMQIAQGNHVLIDHNTIHSITPNLAQGDHSDSIQVMTGTTYLPTTDLTVSNNALLKGSGDYAQGVFIQSESMPAKHSNILVENNVYSGISAHGISLLGVSGAIVRGNTVLTSPGASWDARINLDWSDNIQVYDNVYSQSLVTNSTGVTWTNNIDSHFGGTLDAMSVENLFVNPMNPGSTDLNDFAVRAGSLAETMGAGADIGAIAVAGDYLYYSSVLASLKGGGVLHQIV